MFLNLLKEIEELQKLRETVVEYIISIGGVIDTDSLMYILGKVDGELEIASLLHGRRLP